MKLTIFYSDGTHYNLIGNNISVHESDKEVKIRVLKVRKVSNISIKDNSTITIDRKSVLGYRISKSKGNQRDVKVVALSDRLNLSKVA